MTPVESNKPTWNFFRRADEPELWCAVPASEALPNFLLSGEWRFSGHQLGNNRNPPGFNAEAAEVGEHYNGFHLFQLTTRASAAWSETR